jgi:hemerythrin-like domain-containing protein
MKPIDVLIDEHRLVEQVLNCLERMTDKSVLSGAIDAEDVKDAVVFFRTFVEGWHFPREEAYLTVAMDIRGAGPDGTDPPQFHDHRRCGTHLAGMEHAGRSEAEGNSLATKSFAEHARKYIDVMMKHIEDEEDRMFSEIETGSTNQTHAEATEAFYRAEAERYDQRRLEMCVDIANRLADQLKVPLAPVSQNSKLP